MADRRILARLRSAEGHLRGVQEMVEKDAYCMDVIRQTRAVQSALDRVNALLLERHLNHCVRRAVGSPRKQEQQKVLGELLDLFGREGRR
jgi:DNA-binding FrmR family transcriptional regulator